MIAPKLRFSEFKDEWKKEPLGKVVNFSNGKRIPLSEAERKIRQGEYRYYGASGVIDYIDDYIFDGQYILIGEDGANILNRSSPLAFVVNGKFWVNNHAHIFQSKLGNNLFLATYLESLNYEKHNSGTAQPKLNLENLKKIEVANPSTQEQTKIAEFLSAVDDKISQLSRQLELLNQYKKGVMQKIFSQEIRFKNDNGEDFGEWEEKTIKDICDVKGGKRLPKGYSLVENNTGFPYITVSDMNNGSVSLEKIRYIPENAVNQIKNYRITTKDIFISVAGTLGLIGIIPKELENANLTENADKLTNIQCHQKYLYYFLKNGSLDRLIDNVSTVGAQPKLALYAIQEMEIQIPTIQEQEKIAEFLTAIDKRIDHTTAQLTHTKQWKKGLLQQMFV